MSAHDDFIVITRRSLVAAARIDDGDAAAIFCLHVTIRKTELPQQFHPADFKPNEVIGMIDDAHLVGFRVAHPNTSLSDHWVMVLASTHSPFHTGSRTSRN